MSKINIKLEYEYWSIMPSANFLVIFPQSKTDANEDNPNVYSNVDIKHNITAYTTYWTDVYISLILVKWNRLLYGIFQ